MAKKKSGGGAIGAVVLVGLAALASVPKDVWIAIGVLGAIGAVVYFFVKSTPTSSRDHPPQEDRAGWNGSPRHRRNSSVWSPGDEPVSLGRGSVPPESFKVPPNTQPDASVRWVPFGEWINVAGTSIPGGMLYVGKSVRAPHDPALINTTKHVDRSGDYRQRGFGYWPSYSEISASARRAYLNWLAGGRKDPAADIGYVFLYFYGLERRAILDAPNDPAAQADWPRIADELRRLLAIYGHNGSFNGYANGLLSWVSLATYSSKSYLEPLPEYQRSWELPLHFRLVLGQCAADKVPVPPHIALAWARLDPGHALRTPAVRCAAQFETLFKLKYKKQFGDGLVLPVAKTKLKYVYRAASAAFHGYGNINLSFGDVPDVAVLTGPTQRMQALVGAVTTELEGFSRFLGRNPGAEASPEAVLLLPPAVWPEAVRERLHALKTRVDRGMVVLKGQELQELLGGTSAFNKDRISALARALESMQIATEPDFLAGAKAPKVDDTIVLFSAAPSDIASRSAPAYRAAVLTLEFGSAVATADGEVGPEELRQLRTQVERWTHLTSAHQQRLRAHMRLLIETPVSLTTLKKKIEPLDAVAREAIARFMAVLAQADGVVSPAEIKVLGKIYKVLGIDPDKVFSDVHAVAASAPRPVEPASAKPSSTDPAPSGFQLDHARIAALQKDTQDVSALLASIFKEEEPKVVAPAAAPDEPVESNEVVAPAGLNGLDEAHASFARVILSRPNWSRDELLDVATDLDLMLDGALERINEASFDAHDTPLTEGDDPIEVNIDLIERVPA